MMEASNTQGTKRDRDPEYLAGERVIERKMTKVYEGVCAQKKEKWHLEWLSVQNSSPFQTTIALEDAEKNYHKSWEMLRAAQVLSFTHFQRAANDFDEAERSLEVAKLKWEAVRMQKEDFYTHKMETIFNCRTQLALEIVQTKEDYLLNLNAEDKDMLNLNFHPEAKEALLEQRMSALFAQHRQQQQAKRERYEAMYEDVHKDVPAAADPARSASRISRLSLGKSGLHTFFDASSCTDAPPSEVPAAVYERKRETGIYPTATSAPIALGPNMDDAASSAVPSWTAPPT
jgi:hypothetical protein